MRPSLSALILVDAAQMVIIMNMKKQISKNVPMNIPCQTVGEILDYMAEYYPKKGSGYLSLDKDVFYSYPEIKTRALYLLDCLQKKGVRKGDIVIVETEEPEIFHAMFWACMYGGIIISSIQAPALWEKNSKSLEIFSRQLEQLNMPFVVTQQSHVENYKVLSDKSFSLLVFEELKSEQQAVPVEQKTDDIIYIQFSSGTTGIPEGAMLSHRNIIFSCASTAKATKLGSEDTVLSWLPHTHNLGLFAPLIIAMMLGNSGYYMKPSLFLQNPLLFLRKIMEYHAAWFCINNFGLEWMIQKVPAEALADLNLSSIKSIFAGAENISRETIQRFSEKFGVCGIEQKVIRPGYGMTEATLVVSLTQKETGSIMECISRKEMMCHNQAVLIETENRETKDAVWYTGNGIAVKDVSIRIVDDNNNVLPERVLGEIQVAGDCLFQGYYHTQQSENEKIMDGWLCTGDIGYLSNQQLFIVGRKKDVAVIRGTNYMITDIEACISENTGIPKAILALVGIMQNNQEELAGFVQYQDSLEKFAVLSQKIREVVRAYYQLELSVVLPIKTIPKTSTGKIMRYMLKMQYESGMYKDIAEKMDAMNQHLVAENKTEAEAEAETKKKLLECWGEILHLPEEEISDSTPFASLGGNSIQAYQLLLLLSKKFKIDLGQEVIAKYNTVSKMEHYLKELSNAEIEEKQAKAVSEEKVVITGIGLRLPNAKNQDEFWKNLQAGKDSISRVSEKRKKLAKAPEWNDWIGEVKSIDSFDCDFFDISYEEAKYMDPQQRMAMEVAYEALEDAGMIQDEKETENVGVYACVCENSYKPLLFDYVKEHGCKEIPSRTLVNNMHNMIAARISHQYGFTGPVMAVDSACSSFMTGIHLAKTAILNDEIQGAVVVGANIIATEYMYALAKNAGIISSSNMSKVFDANADGSILGEGIIVVYLQKMSEAVHNHCHIYGVICGSTINNDGYALSITSPNPRGQYNVLHQAYVESGISSNDISYVETHGTGTVIGDPIEISALSKQFADYSRNQKIAVGSVKTNIGHLLSAAAGAGILKVLLCLKHRQLVPSLHMNEVNPLLEIDKKPFRIITENEPWDVPEHKTRIAGITSLGLGGTNGHVIISEYKPAVSKKHAQEQSGQHHILTVSAKTESALQQIIAQTQKLLKNQEISIADLCMTRNRYRKHYEWRAACIVDENGNLLSEMTPVNVHRQVPPEIGILIGNVKYSLTEKGFYQIYHKLQKYQELLQPSAEFFGVENGAVFVACLNGEISEAEAMRRYFVSDAEGLQKPVQKSVELLLCIGECRSTDFPDAENMQQLKGIAEDTPDMDDVLETVKNLYLHGVKIQWNVLYSDETRTMLSLPAYPFTENHVWID